MLRRQLNQKGQSEQSFVIGPRQTSTSTFAAVVTCKQCKAKAATYSIGIRNIGSINANTHATMPAVPPTIAATMLFRFREIQNSQQQIYAITPKWALYRIQLTQRISQICSLSAA
jgi:hypothetical protein